MTSPRTSRPVINDGVPVRARVAGWAVHDDTEGPAMFARPGRIVEPGWLASTAMHHLIHDSESLGVKVELPRFVKALADRAVTDGHSGSS